MVIPDISSSLRPLPGAFIDLRSSVQPCRLLPAALQMPATSSVMSFKDLACALHGLRVEGNWQRCRDKSSQQRRQCNAKRV